MFEQPRHERKETRAMGVLAAVRALAILAAFVPGGDIDKAVSSAGSKRATQMEVKKPATHLLTRRAEVIHDGGTDIDVDTYTKASAYAARYGIVLPSLTDEYFMSMFSITLVRLFELVDEEERSYILHAIADTPYFAEYIAPFVKKTDPCQPI